MKHLRVRKLVGASVICLALASPVAFGGGLSRAATVTPTGDGLSLEYQDESGAKFQETIPIYHAGAIRYFSAGVGLEERSAKFPVFPLKLIFVAGSKAYLSQVAVTITNTENKVRLEVPRERVAGPWLFVDLPPGTYEITAEGPGKTQIKERVTLSAKQNRTVYMRWKEETT